ncbi:MAG: 2-succinyl-5-enolpyruvyl-6-hydroxy-3-cyclohexene-1-carboxylate synthase, partial [Psychromonas sp.]|nr:2-succinyl-5-enolpyruvyl-6-hydroxy-3-cyclohexene-1-carboxylate synthase [Psychromonas sp.]
PTAETVDYQQYLSSLKRWRANGLPFTQFIKNQTVAIAESDQLIGKRVLIIAAKIDSKKETEAICRFAKDNNFPLFADIQSSQSGKQNNLHYYDLLLINEAFISLLQQADIIIQFGEQLISKRLTELMGSFEGELQLIKSGETRIDANHQLDIRYNCNAIEWIKAQALTPSKLNNSWFEALKKCHQGIAQKVIDPFLAKQLFSEMTIVNQLDKLLIKDKPLFIGNSMPIRLADMLMNSNQAEIFTNRGASGIDGLLATAVGVAKKSKNITTLLIGDSSFLYDLNSLALLKQLETSFIIIVINNDGGAIFNMLPVPEAQRSNFYQLPHGLNFKASCEQFCIDYHNPNQLIDFAETYNQCLQGKHSLIEVTLENQQSATQLEQLKEQVKYATS